MEVEWSHQQTRDFSYERKKRSFDCSSSVHQMNRPAKMQCLEQSSVTYTPICTTIQPNTTTLTHQNHYVYNDHATPPISLHPVWIEQYHCNNECELMECTKTKRRCDQVMSCPKCQAGQGGHLHHILEKN